MGLLFISTQYTFKMKLFKLNYFCYFKNNKIPSRKDILEYL